MHDESLRTALGDAEGRTFSFFFTDGEETLARVLSATHVDEDDTVIVDPVGEDFRCSLQISLADIRALNDADGRCLFTLSE